MFPLPGIWYNTGTAHILTNKNKSTHDNEGMYY